VASGGLPDKSDASKMRRALYHGYVHGWGPTVKGGRPLPLPWCVVDVIRSRYPDVADAPSGREPIQNGACTPPHTHTHTHTEAPPRGTHTVQPSHHDAMD
jgi:hypothetical protein